MAQPYLDDLRGVVARARLELRGVSCKHFFSGAAAYLGEHILGSLTPKGLALKLPTERCEELFAERRAVPLQYFEKSPVKKGYALFPNYRAMSDTETAELLSECLRHVRRKR